MAKDLHSCESSPVSDFNRDINVDEVLNLNPFGCIKYYLDFIPAYCHEIKSLYCKFFDGT
jgi:hypothetical protein